jgi:NitT/TauT family transport system substrate-binding protein
MMPVTRRAVVAGLASAPFFVPAFVRSASADELIKLAVPQKGNWDSMVVVQGDEQGIFKKLGIALDITYTSGGSDTIQVVATGSVDIAMATGTTASIGAYAHGAPVRIMSAQFTGAPDMYWYVRPDSPIRSMTDMNGKSMGFSRPGSSTYAVSHLLAKDAHVTPNFVSAGEQSANRTMVLSGQLDAGWASAPTNFDLLEDKKIRIIAKGADVAEIRAQTVRVNIGNIKFLGDRRDTATRFLKGYAQSIDWIYANQNDALKRYLTFNPNLTPEIAKQVVKYFPKSALSLTVLGFTQSIADAIAFKSIDQPLTADQTKDIFSPVYAAYASR